MFGSGLWALVRGGEVWEGAGGIFWLGFYEDLGGIPYVEAPKLFRPPRKLGVSGICGGGSPGVFARNFLRLGP